MTADERDAMDRAALAFRQIECLLMLVREAIDDPALGDAIGGVETLANREGEALGKFV